jgi:hypothetical protein
MKKALLLLPFLLLLDTACAPTNAREIRELRPTSVGLLGVAYRPNGDHAVGLVGGAIGTSLPAAPIGADADDQEERDTKLRSSASIGAFYHYYPMADSAFFVGAGFTHSSQSYSFNERTNSYSDSNKDTTKVKFSSKATWIGVPLGWGWIWENGFTLILDLGPRVRVGYSKSYSDDGEDDDVDTDRRDDYVEDLDGRKFTVGGGGLIGYSF